MDVAFNTQRLRSLCEVETEMIEEFGRTAAEALQVCLADLDAATTIADIAANYAVEGGATSDIELSPISGLRIRLRPNDRKYRQNKVVDWSAVVRVKIMEISFRA